MSASAPVRSDHHRRQRPLGAAARAAGDRGAPGGRRRGQGAAARRGRAGDRGADRLLLLDRELVAADGGGRGADGDVRRADRRRDAGARRGGRADALHRPPRGRSPRSWSSGWSGPKRRPPTNDRITLFVAFNYGGRAEIVDAARSFKGRLRGGVPSPPLRARDARSRPPDPNQRRAADLQLPALAVRLLGAGLPRRALAGLRPRGVRGGPAASSPTAQRRFGART